MTFRSTLFALELVACAAVSGCISIEPRVGIHAASAESGDPFIKVHLRPEPTQPNPVCYDPEQFITGADVDSFSETTDQNGEPALAFRLKDDATELMRATTSERIGEPMVITLDGEVIFAPIVMSTIGRDSVVTGTGDTDWLERLKEALAEAGAAETGGPATR